MVKKMTIDEINTFIHNAFRTFTCSEYIERNNFYSEGEYALDCLFPKRGKIMFRLRNSLLKNFCAITIEKNILSIKYSTDFYFVLKETKKGIMLTSSITGKKSLNFNELKNDFEEVFSDKFNTRIDLDYDVLLDTLTVLFEHFMEYKEQNMGLLT